MIVKKICLFLISFITFLRFDYEKIPILIKRLDEIRINRERLSSKKAVKRRAKNRGKNKKAVGIVVHTNQQEEFLTNLRKFLYEICPVYTAEEIWNISIGALSKMPKSDESVNVVKLIKGKRKKLKPEQIERHCSPGQIAQKCLNQ